MLPDSLKNEKSPIRLTLTLLQEEFCMAFLTQESELYGNGTKAYLATYGREYKAKKGKEMSYQVAMGSASDLLKTPKIVNRISELLETGGFNNENIDKQLLFVVNQNSDMASKVAAIKEFNKLKARIQDRLDITSGGKPIPIVTIERPDQK